MNTETPELRKESRASSAAWLAAAVGTAIGVGALASRKRRTRWDRARDRASDLIGTARKEYEPWMGIAAGTAAAGTALAAYLRSRRESRWQRTSRRAGEIASRVGAHATNRWAHIAASAAVGLVSMAYANQARRRTIRGIDAGTAGKINSLTEKALQVARRVRGMSEQSGKLYPRVRRAMA
jgi:hypothetical protein